MGDVASIGEAVVARALAGYHGCMCDECLIPYLYEATEPYIRNMLAAEEGS